MRYMTDPYAMSVSVTTPPATEPVTLDELKAHLRVTSNDEDDYLTSMITVARTLVEDWTRRKLITQSLTGWLDYPSLSTLWWEGSITAAQSGLMPIRAIQLPYCPTISVVDLALYAIDDTEFLVDPATYRFDASDPGRPARITLKESVVWPGGSYRNQNSLRVRWSAGYGAASAVPAPLRLAIKMLAAFLYVNRGECTGADDCLASCGAMPLIQTYKVYSL